MKRFRRPPAWWLFWGSLSIILYSYIGFPLLVVLRGLLRPRPISRAEITPPVSVIIPAYNEARFIVKKLDNTLALDYPRQQLEIIVASDGSDDETEELVAGYNAPEVRLLRLPRRGMNATVTDAAAAARGEILIMTDADTMLAPDALRQVVAPFHDPDVGAVGAEHRYTSKMLEGVSGRSFWTTKRGLRELQSRAGSMTAAEGPFYAVRRSLFKPLPSGVAGDLYTSIHVAARHRLVFEPRAVGYELAGTPSKASFQRKVRVMTRGLQTMWLARQWLNPLQGGFSSVQVLSHKLLRCLMPVPLLIFATSALALWRYGWFYRLAAVSQLALHGAAALGFALRGTRAGRLKILSMPYFFDMVNAAAIIAIFKLLRGERRDIWVSRRTAERVLDSDATS